MSNLREHALKELRAIGMTTDDPDEYNLSMTKHILDMIDVFGKGGHSGFSASYAIGLLNKLLNFEPLTPLTGEDSEWVSVAEQSGYPLYQNNRASSVFKDVDGAYDIDGIVFYDELIDDENKPFRSYFTDKNSRALVTFPYTPTTVYKLRIAEKE